MLTGHILNVVYNIIIKIIIDNCIKSIIFQFIILSTRYIYNNYIIYVMISICKIFIQFT